MWVQSLGQEDPLEKEMATQSCLGNPMVRSLVGYSPWGCKRVGDDLVTTQQQQQQQIYLPTYLPVYPSTYLK